MPYTRPTDEGDVQMVEIRPHVAVRADFAQANGMSVYVPKPKPEPEPEPKPKAGRAK